MANSFPSFAHPCYTSQEMEVGLLVGSKSALLANLQRWCPERGDKAKLARDLGRSYATVSRWFSGDREPNLDDLDRIAAWLGRRPQELLVDYSKEESTGVTPREALEIITAALNKNS